MIEVAEVIKLIGNTNSSNDKLYLLKKNEHVPDLKKNRQKGGIRKPLLKSDCLAVKRKKTTNGLTKGHSEEGLRR